MSRLPPTLQPLWPVAKRLHRLASLVLGSLGRRLSGLLGERGLPRTGSATSARTAALEPDAVTFHSGPEVARIRREVPPGRPPAHWALAAAADRAVPPLSVLEVRHGLVTGDFGAIVTPGGVLDHESSHYWGIAGWQEHPLFLRPRLPAIEEVAGSLAVLTTRGGHNSYYHFLFDVLPRLEVLRRTLPDARPDHYLLPQGAAYHEQLLGLAGLAGLPVLPSGARRAYRAERLLVPSLPNHDELTPEWVVTWLRELLLRPTPGRDLPRRLYVTRAGGRHTRQLLSEDELWPRLEERGFARIDPGSLGVQDQIDHFAAADVVLGVHGAALTNLVFSPPGVRVLHLMAPTYVKHCFWAILDAIPGARYRYLLGDGTPVPPGGRLDGIQDDIDLDPQVVLGELDALLS